VANYDDRLGDYVDVPTRIAEFREKHPGGSLQPFDPTHPYRIETIGDRTYIVVVAAAYRSPDDLRPGIGMAYEQWPGRTPYTRDSELQNAETSAWGRAIVATLAADTKRGIASAEEVRNRQAEREPNDALDKQMEMFGALLVRIDGAADETALMEHGAAVKAAKDAEKITKMQYERLARRASERVAEFRMAVTT